MTDPDRPGEACGVFGVRAPGEPVAHLTYLGLYALQHRGQESAGMAVGDTRSVTVVRDMGLVSHVFDERTLGALAGEVAIGHTRYSTTGSSSWDNSQPVYRGLGSREFALGHNGNLVNTTELAAESGAGPRAADSDSELIADLLGAEVSAGVDLPDALARVLPRLAGAYSLVVCDDRRLIGARDPNGFRPLVLGRLAGGGHVLASETPALDIVGAEPVREVEPGEVVVVDAGGVRWLRPFEPEAIRPHLCMFEFVYFARPDGVLMGRDVQGARQRMGERLAAQAPLAPDPAGRPAMVMPVPDSGVPAAQGFARASGIPYGDGLVKNRYIGRTFIAPTPALRERAVRLKLNPVRAAIAGKRLVVVDDSIVRGTTTRALVRMLREAGAAEVHMRVSSPPYRWPCHYGMDTGDADQLLAARMDTDAIAGFLGVDSLSYLELDGLLEAIGADPERFCTACCSGRYPVPVPGLAASPVALGAPGSA